MKENTPLFLHQEMNLLSNEEFRGLFIKYHNGDENAREKILLHSLVLVYYQAKKIYHTTLISFPDLLSIGKIGLIKAVDSFDLEKNIQFNTYASCCINNEILMQYRKVKKQVGAISLDEDILTTDIPLVDTLADSSDLEGDYERKDYSNYIKKLVSTLNSKDQELIHLFHYQGLSQDEIARKYQISQSVISRKLKRIYKELKAKIEEGKILSKNNTNSDNNKKVLEKTL